MVALKIVAIAAVGGTAWLFMRPRFSPVIPPPGHWPKSPRPEPDAEPQAAPSESSEGDAAVPLGSPLAPGPDVASTSDGSGITENELIVHSLLLQGDKLAAAADDVLHPPGALQTVSKELRTTAEQAFWDVLREGLQAQPPQCERLTALIVDTRDQLAALVPKRSPAGQQLLADMMDKLDEEYITSRLEAGLDSGYLRQLLDYTVYVIGCLEAPARQASTRQAYEELGRAFDAAAAAQGKQPGSRQELVRLSMEVRRSTEVPVRVQVRDAWHPVEVAPEDVISPPHTPCRGSLSVSRAPSPNDWVTSFSPSASPRPATPAGLDFSFLSPPQSQMLSQSQRHARRDPWVGLAASAEPTVGTPMEEEVEVRFGMLVESEEVHVQLAAIEPASRSGSTSPAKPDSGKTAATAAVSAQQQALADVVVQAAKFLHEKLRELRSDAARAHLDMLKGLLQGTSSGIEYERRRYSKLTKDRTVKEALPRSHQWLLTALRQVGATRGSESLAPALIQGVLSLVQQPSAVSPAECPETLLLDCSQLVALQNELQRLSLAAAALLISQQLLSSRGESTVSSLPDNSRFYAAVKQRYLFLLGEPGMQLSRLIEAMGSLLKERLGLQQLSAEDDALVSRLLSRVFAIDDPVYQKVQTGIVAGLQVLLHSLCLAPDTQRSETEACRVKLRSFGAELLLPEVAAMAQVIAAIITLNLAVCKPFYCTIMSDL